MYIFIAALFAWKTTHCTLYRISQFMFLLSYGVYDQCTLSLKKFTSKTVDIRYIDISLNILLNYITYEYTWKYVYIAVGCSDWKHCSRFGRRNAIKFVQQLKPKMENKKSHKYAYKLCIIWSIAVSRFFSAQFYVILLPKCKHTQKLM